MIEGSGNPAAHTRSGGRRRASQADSNRLGIGRGLLLGRNPSWRRAYHALLTSISHGQDLRRKMFRDRLELRELAAPDGVALLRERDQEFESGSLQRRVVCEPRHLHSMPGERERAPSGLRSSNRARLMTRPTGRCHVVRSARLPLPTGVFVYLDVGVGVEQRSRTLQPASDVPRRRQTQRRVTRWD